MDAAPGTAVPRESFYYNARAPRDGFCWQRPGPAADRKLGPRRWVLLEAPRADGFCWKRRARWVLLEAPRTDGFCWKRRARWVLLEATAPMGFAGSAAGRPDAGPAAPAAPGGFKTTARTAGDRGPLSRKFPRN